MVDMRLHLLRYGEIGTKSDNIRSDFENILIQNIERAFLKEEREVFIEKERGRIYAYADESSSYIFSKIFGLVSYSPATERSSDPDEIVEEVLRDAEGKRGTFAVRARRTGTQNYTSQRLEEIIGEAVLESNDDLSVDLDNPDHVFYVEVRNGRSYIFEEIYDSPGGLPLSSQGKAVGYLKDEKDFLAIWLLMKRGVRTYIFHHPETSFLDRLKRWDYNLHILGSGGLEELEQHELPGYIEALILGDTLSEITEIEHRLPALRPLIGFTEDMIQKHLRYIEGLESTPKASG